MFLSGQIYQFMGIYIIKKNSWKEILKLVILEKCLHIMFFTCLKIKLYFLVSSYDRLPLNMCYNYRTLFS